MRAAETRQSHDLAAGPSMARRGVFFAHSTLADRGGAYGRTCFQPSPSPLPEWTAQIAPPAPCGREYRQCRYTRLPAQKPSIFSKPVSDRARGRNGPWRLAPVKAGPGAELARGIYDPRPPRWQMADGYYRGSTVDTMVEMGRCPRRPGAAMKANFGDVRPGAADVAKPDRPSAPVIKGY